jgi:large subunit ribosomal protein L18
MKINRTTKLKFKRRTEGKTDYARRLRLLESRLPRLVVRKTSNYIQAQLVEFDPKGDKTLVSANSRSLKKIGWNFSCKNLPAAYLTGLALGKVASQKNIKQAVLDIGLYSSTKGNKIYAAAKGARDAGLDVSVGEGIAPAEERISGKHIADGSDKFKEITSKFEQIKQTIMKGN